MSAMDAGGEVPDSEKARIASEFIMHAPPGEFNDVFNDVRILLDNDELLKEKCGPAITKHYKNNFAPVQLEGTGEPTLMTPFNELPDGRFFDPKSEKVFRYDFLKKEAFEIENATPAHIDQALEPWRIALQEELDDYLYQHYLKSGVGTVFAHKGAIVLCIESHQFQPKNYWNGMWRSQWTIPVSEDKSTEIELQGVVKMQVHYYEEGNVQLISNKKMTAKYTFSNNIKNTAKLIMSSICDQETLYQTAVQENYVNLSDTTFKALRRQLPVTRTKLDWLKIHSYRVAQDLRPQ
uniref:F-actin-capping protein subunit alpha n=1 Tax=Steinernema glaseri TaxID=37863 RepID=A0A1I7Z6E2_9BILA